MRHLILFTILSLLAGSSSAQTRITVNRAGRLGQTLSAIQQDTITSLIVEGPLNSADIRVLRRMGGYAEQSGDKVGRLQTLDLRSVQFVTDRHPYLVLDAGLEGMVIHSLYAAFRGAGASTPTPVQHHDGNWSTSFSSNGQHTVYYVLGDQNKAHTEEPFQLFGLDSRSLRLSPRPTQAQLKSIRSTNMKKTLAHRLAVQDGKVLLQCMVKKNTYSYTMFHGCTTLQDVAIPTKAAINRNVIVHNNPIHHVQLRQQ